MYKSTMQRFKTREVVLVLILIFMLMYSFPLIKTKINRFRTLSSLKAIGKDGIYTMDYALDYRLDHYLKQGSRNLKQLYDFIDKTTSIPFISNGTYSVFNEDIYDLSSFKDYGESDECSAFSAIDKSGNPIFGRNLDVKGSHPVLVLFTNPAEGYSSISVVEIPILGCSDDNDVLKDQFKQYSNRVPLLRAPYMPRDGMNEKGLTVATLNVPEETVTKDNSKATLGRWQVLRMLLDKASTVKEAVDLLMTYNCFDGSVHYLIADASGNSVVAEFTNGKMSIVPSEGNYQVVTNFYLSKSEDQGKGRARYKTCSEKLSSTNGILDEASAISLLSLIKEPSTAYSIVYNQGTGEVFLAFNKNYYNIYNFRLKLK